MSLRFQFGQNWQAYLSRHFSEQTLHRSTQALQDFLPVDLADKTFLDVGCGSGVHSLSAVRLGARKVVSFDADPHSVEGTDQLRSHLAPHSTWEVEQGSMLDKTYLHRLGQFDVVYCWGVAHHTGELWRALGNLPELVAPGGLLFVAVYNRVEGRFGSRWWLKVKSFYNRIPSLGKKVLEWGYITYNFLKLILHGRHPWSYMRDYKQKRGMSWKIDLIDWLGGYPYEYASVEEVFMFFKEKHGMDLLRLKTTRHIGCNQFVFRK